MLYQTWESNPLEYALHDPGYPFHKYEGCFIDEGAGFDSLYKETLNCGAGEVFHIFSQRDESVGSHTTIYVYAMMAYRYSPTFRIVVYAIDGQSGEILWKDVESWTMNVFLVGLLQGYMIDLDSRTWVDHAYGFTYRTTLFDGESTENNFAKAPGMPNMLFWDIRIDHDEWLATDGSPLTGVGVTQVFAVLPSQNRAICRYHDDTAETPTSFSNDRWVYVGIFNYTTKRRIADLKIPGNLLKVVAVDSSIVYGFHAGGMVSVIDYKVPRIKGVIYVGPETGIGGVSRWIAAGYDPVYRRLLASAPSPDTEEGGSTVTVKAYAPREVPQGLLKPIPQQIPRQGRTIGIFSRLYGDGGHGIPGVKVSAAITSGGNNTINPSVQISDADGHVFYKYTCNDPGSDIDDIELTAEFDAVDPSFTPSGNQTVTISAPSKVGNTLYFEPGHWGWSPHSDASPAAKWDAFLDGYAPGPHPLRGIVQEYAWTDIETGTLTYTYAKVQADIDYLSARGLKLMIAIKFKSPDDDTPWVPDDILDYVQPPPPLEDEPPIVPIYPQSQQLLAITKRYAGVIHLDNTQGAGWYPMIWAAQVKSRIITLLTSITTQYIGEDTVVGYFPIWDDYLESDDIFESNTGGSPYLFMEERRNILSWTAGLTGKLVWEITTGSGLTSAHWCKDNGVMFTTDHWNLAQSEESYFFASGTKGIFSIVATGLRIQASDWGQDNCEGADATPEEFVFGGIDMNKEDPPCQKAAALQFGRFWFAFYDLVEPQYSLVDEGIEAVGLNRDLPLSDAYRGG